MKTNNGIQYSISKMPVSKAPLKWALYYNNYQYERIKVVFNTKQDAINHIKALTVNEVNDYRGGTVHIDWDWK